MFLSDIFEQLTQGELSQLYVGKVDEQGIQVCDYPKIVPHVNLAVTELHKRFLLKSGEVVVQQYDQIQRYYLKSKYAQTNLESDEPIKYIMDSPYQPFEDDVLRIEKVINELGEELFINDQTEYWTINTPSFNSIQVPYPEKENQMIITYRANAPKILIPNLVPEEQEVDIPSYLLEPLLFYVGSRAFGSMNSDNNAEGNNYVAKFEKSCLKISELGLDNEDNTANVRLDSAGWV